jgi:NitT/TauT family transport system substrate-binding protein
MGKTRISVVAMVVTLVAAACGGAGAPKQLTDVKIVIPLPTLFTTGLPVYVAEAQGFYAKQGLKVEMVNTQGGGSNVQTVVSGSADIGLETGPFAVLAAYAKGAPVRIVSASTTGLDLFWFASGTSTYHALTDLAGQKVGFSEPGSSSDVGVHAMNAALTAKGLKPVVPQALGGIAQQLAAVKTGQVASGFSAPPTFLDQVASGALRIVVKGSDLGEYRDVAVRVNFANSDFIKAHPDAMRGFLKAEQDAIAWIFAHHDEAIALWKTKAELKADDKTLQSVFDFYSPQTQRLAPLGGQDKILADATSYGFLTSPLSSAQIKEVFDLTYVP